MANQSDTVAPTFTILVDNEPIETDQHNLTVQQILELSGHVPASDYCLLQYRGQSDQKTKHCNLQESIRIHEGLRFAALFQWETPVS